MKRVAGGGKVPIRESGCRIIEVQTLSFRRISVLFCNREDGIHWLPLVLFSFLCWLKEVVCSNWSKALIRKAKKFGPRGNGQLIGERIYPCMDLTLIILLFILSTYCFSIFFPFFLLPPMFGDLFGETIWETKGIARLDKCLKIKEKFIGKLHSYFKWIKSDFLDFLKNHESCSTLWTYLQLINLWINK